MAVGLGLALAWRFRLALTQPYCPPPETVKVGYERGRGFGNLVGNLIP